MGSIGVCLNVCICEFCHKYIVNKRYDNKRVYSHNLSTICMCECVYSVHKQMGVQHINKNTNFVQKFYQHNSSTAIRFGSVGIHCESFQQSRDTACMCLLNIESRSQQPVKPIRMFSVIISLFPDAKYYGKNAHNIISHVYNHRCIQCLFFFSTFYVQSTFRRYFFCSSIFIVDTQFHLFSLQFPCELCHRSFCVV